MHYDVIKIKQIIYACIFHKICKTKHLRTLLQRYILQTPQTSLSERNDFNLYTSISHQQHTLHNITTSVPNTTLQLQYLTQHYNFST